MAYTGTGTQDDPYVVDDWDSLIEKIAEVDTYVTVADNVDIDLTKIYPEGIPYSNAQPLLNFACKEFDGNGIIIRNAYNLNVRTGSTSVVELAATCNTVSNFNFVNFYINTGTLPFIRGRGTTSVDKLIAHSTFKGVVFTTNYSNYEPISNIGRFFDCVWNTKCTFTGNGYVSHHYPIFDSCWVRFDTNRRWANNGGSFVNTYIEGTFRANHDNSPVFAFGNSLCSILNANIVAGDYTGCTITAGSSATMCLINSDKVEEGITLDGTTSAMIEVTDSQLKDYDYLKDIFPVVPNEEGSGG